MATASVQSSSTRKSWLLPLLYLLGGGALLGLSTNLAKLAGETGLSPVIFLGGATLGASLILFMVAALKRVWPPCTRRSIEYYFVSAAVGVVIPNLIFFSAVTEVGAGFVVLVIALPPLLTYIGALTLRMERFQWLRALGVLAALGGAGVLAVHKLSAPQADIAWVLLTLLGPVALAIGNVYRTARWPAGASADALAPGMLLAATVLLVAIGFLPRTPLDIPQQDQGFVYGLIALQSVVFAGMFFLLFLLQKTGGPVLISLLGAVGAVVGVPVAIFLQGEAAPQGLAVGAGLIALGVAMLTLGQQHESKTKMATQPRA